MKLNFIMKKKLTTSDLKQHILAEVKKLHRIEVLKEEKSRLNKELKLLSENTEDNSNLRAMLHTLVGSEMRLGKRADMYGGVGHHVEEHRKAEKELENFLKENPSMLEFVEEVEEHFAKQLYK